MIPVSVEFQNNSAIAMKIVMLDENDKETKIVQQIEVNHKVVIEKITPGSRCKLKDTNDRDIAVYTVDNTATVSLRDLLALTKPQKVTFLNTLSDPCEVLWFDEFGIERNFATLKPKQKVSTPDISSKQATRPNDRWSIRVKGELVADYVVTTDAIQTIDLASLAKQFKNRVVMFVNNTTKSQIDVRLQLTTPQPDGTKELVYRSGILPGDFILQLAQANTQWKFVDTKTGATLGVYRTTSDKSQQVDLSKLNQ